jgi:hypothetical protein
VGSQQRDFSSWGLCGRQGSPTVQAIKSSDTNLIIIRIYSRHDSEDQQAMCRVNIERVV